MLCTKAILRSALGNYARYLPTASEHLRETREKWIPVHVKKKDDKRRVRQISEHILTGIPAKGWPGPWQPLYNTLKEEHQVAVALCVLQAWAEHLQSLPRDKRSSKQGPLNITKRVGAFLAGISLDHATLAIRNWSWRDRTKINAMEIICDGRVTKDECFMRVYINIRARWDTRGYDWERRAREERALPR